MTNEQNRSYSQSGAYQHCEVRYLWFQMHMDTNFKTSVTAHISHNFLETAYKIYSDNISA